MKKILMLILPVIAFLGGAIGGDMLHGGSSKAKGDDKAAHATTDPKAESDAPHTAAETAAAESGHGGEGGRAEAASGTAWFRFPNQFFVPILRNGATDAVMVMSLTLEMPEPARADIEAREHRLRDALLNALMIQANTGGFDGNFTSEPSLERLRRALLAAAQKAAGPQVAQVLIEDIARQDQ